MQGRPPTETVTPAVLSQVHSDLDRIAELRGLTRYMLAVIAHEHAATDELPTAERLAEIRAALARGEDVRCLCGRYHLSRWALEQIRASEGTT